MGCLPCSEKDQTYKTSVKPANRLPLLKESLSQFEFFIDMFIKADQIYSSLFYVNRLVRIDVPGGLGVKYLMEPV